jgi:hypothetical protein
LSGRRRYRLTGLIVLAALVPHADGSAQTQGSGRMVFGLTGGFDRANLQISLPVCTNADCGIFDAGTMERRGFGARVDLPDLLSAGLGLSIRAEWRSSTLDMVTPSSPVWLHDPVSGTDRSVDHQFRYRVTTSRVMLGGLVGLHLFGPLSIGLGGRAGVHVSSSAQEKDQLDPNSSVTFDGGVSARPVPDGTSFTPRPFSADAQAAAWTQLPLGGRLALSVEVGGSYGLLGESTNWGERGGAITTSLSLLLLPPGPPAARTSGGQMADRLTPPDTAESRTAPTTQTQPAETQPPQPLPPATEPSRPTPRYQPPSASIRLSGIDDRNAEGTARVEVRERVDRSVVVVRPRIMFDTDSPVLPADCVASTGKAPVITEDSIAEETGACRLLDMVGIRMRADAEASIALRESRRGNQVDDERGRAIRTYLQGRWGIAPERIGRSSRAASDPDAVEIEAVRGNVLAPIRVESVSRTFGTPRLKIEPYYQADAGVRHWEIVLTHRGTPIARYENSGAGDERRTDYDWHPDYATIATDTAALEAHFTVEDSTGARATADGRIRLGVEPVRFVVEHEIDEPGRKEVISWTLPAAAADELGGAIAPEVAAETRRDDRLEIMHGNRSEKIVERGDRLRELLPNRLKRAADGGGTIVVRLERKIRG